MNALSSALPGRLRALVMVQRLYADDGGVESESDAFARSVDADQMIEIERMQGMLDERTR